MNKPPAPQKYVRSWPKTSKGAQNLQKEPNKATVLHTVGVQAETRFKATAKAHHPWVVTGSLDGSAHFRIDLPELRTGGGQS